MAEQSSHSGARTYRGIAVSDGVSHARILRVGQARRQISREKIAPEAVDLPGLSLALGADVPVCLAARTARMGGIGERIEPAPRLPGFGLLLANPHVALATPDVFRARRGDFAPPADLPPAWPDAAAMAADLSRLGNDLEAAAITLCSPVAQTLAAIAARPGCLLARMSGSGATCFGLFATPERAAAAAAALPDAWWRWGGACR